MRPCQRLLLMITTIWCVIGECNSGKIRHIVLLIEENRSFDHMFGFRQGVHGLNGTESNPIDPTYPSKGRVFVSADAPDVALCDPDHNLPPTTWKIYGPEGHSGPDAVPTMEGFVSFEYLERNETNDTNYCGVMQSLHKSRTPVLNALADSFVLMDAFHASVPGPTWPNRMFCLSGTSAGQTETDNPWFQGILGSLFPQRTIFDQLAESGLTWRNYVGDGPWELFMNSIAQHPESILEMSAFYSAAAAGNLPNFSYISPRAGMSVSTGESANDMHPDHSVAEGELLIKNIYEALVASPQWNETLFIVTFDEHGGFYDHVPPPTDGIPPPDNYSSFPDAFGFDRLGIRIPTLLISPWVPKGVVESSPPDAAKPYPSSKYELSSVISSTRKLFSASMGNVPPLTKRDEWAATFDHLLSETSPRTDVPMTLPDPAPRPHYAFPDGIDVESRKRAHLEDEAKKPVNGLQRHISDVLAHLSGVEPMHHLPTATQRSISPWIQHATAAWKARTSTNQRTDQTSHLSLLSVRCQSYLDTTYASGVWHIDNSSSSSSSSKTAAAVALSVEVKGVKYCLTEAIELLMCGNATNNASGVAVSAPPSEDFFVWLLRDDFSVQLLEQSTNATMQPAVDGNGLCITSSCASNALVSSAVSLAACNGTLDQRWSVFPANPDINFSDKVYLSQGGVWAIVAVVS